jgi:hypothetical protein
MKLRNINKEKRKRFAHIMAAIVILAHAYGNYGTGHHSFLLFLIAGMVVLAVALFHPFLEKKIHWIDGATFMVEGILSIAISYDLFHLDKNALAVGYLLLGLFQFFMAFWKGKKGHQKHKKRQQITTE